MLQDLLDVLAVLLLPDEKQLLLVLRVAARLNHVPLGVLLHELYRLVERYEVPARESVDAGVLQLVLPELPLVLQPLGVDGASHDGFALAPQLLRKLPVTDVVEDDYLRPVLERFPFIDLLDEAVSHILLVLTLREHFHLVSSLRQLPGQVGRERLYGDEKESSHWGTR